MIKINFDSRMPIYDQIKLGLKSLVGTGLLKPGDQAPSIRKLALDLKVNPNTVARAYRELSAEGFFDSSRGEENCISGRALEISKNARAQIASLLESAVQSALENGFSWTDIDAAMSELKRRVK